MKRINFLITLLIAAIFQSMAQNPVPIAQARLTPTGGTVTIQGVVLNGPELGIIRYLQDSTGGLAIYDATKTYMQRGDLVQVTGVMQPYNQLLELVSITNDTVLSTGNPLPAPVLITPSQFGEIHESVMIRINDATFTTSGGTFSGNTNYNIISNGQQAQIRIVNGNPLVGQLIPTTQVDLIGIGSQFSYSNPTAGYQMMLRDPQDIISNIAITFTSPVTVSNITTTGFDLDWTTNIAGSTGVQYGTTPALGQVMTNSVQGTNHQVSLTGLQPAAMVYAKAFSVHGTDTAFSGLNVYATQSLSSGDIKVYFTGSADHSYSTGVNAVQLNNLLDDTLIAYINRADKTIDLAIYSFGTQNISNIAAALNAAHTRGVDVRVVYCGTTANLGIQSLYPAIGKMKSPTSSEYAIMHNKFIIFDANHTDPNLPIVWTGSMNWTETCINNNANNVVIVQDQSLARGYTLEFEEMFGSTGLQPDSSQSRFGPYKTNNTPHEFVIGGRRVKSFFSPSDGVNGEIIRHIESAQHQVFVNTMLITRSDIAYALRDQHLAQKDVKVLVNNDADCTQLVVDVLGSNLGANFREFGESHTLHHKAMLIDALNPGPSTLVWTGSHNWSNAADQRNDENTLVIYDTTIANLYYQEFMKRWGLAIPLAISEKQAAQLSVQLFPNPSPGGIFTLETTAIFEGSGVLMITGIDGRLYRMRNISIPAGLHQQKFNEPLSPGIYLIHLQTVEGTLTKKLIVH